MGCRRKESSLFHVRVGSSGALSCCFMHQGGLSYIVGTDLSKPIRAAGTYPGARAWIQCRPASLHCSGEGEDCALRRILGTVPIDCHERDSHGLSSANIYISGF